MPRVPPTCIGQPYTFKSTHSSVRIALQVDIMFFSDNQCIHRIYAATILKVTYDMDVTDMNDEYVQLAETAIAGLSEAQVPGKFWVQVLPFLRHIPNWVPGIGFKKHLSHYNPLIFKMIQEPFDAIKQDVVSTSYNM